MALDAFRLVLVNPLYAGNIGSVARVAANFEIKDVRVVSPPRGFKESRQALLYAKGPALQYLHQIKECSSLREALKEVVYVVGFTRRQGFLRRAQLRLPEVPQLASLKSKTALVFGREDTGLTTDELRACTHLCSLAVGDTMPSLNLSHAVAVVVARLYEESVLRMEKNPSLSAVEALASHEIVSRFLQHFSRVLVDARMTKGGNPGRTMRRLEKVFQRAQMQEHEVGAFRSVLSKIQAKMKLAEK
jgi:TrmH family RNA methyltransferase